jgi:hypothetical protein
LLPGLSLAILARAKTLGRELREFAKQQFRELFLCINGIERRSQLLRALPTTIGFSRSRWIAA